MTASADVGSIPVEPVRLAPGDEMPVYTLGPLTRTDFVRYAGAAGDLNPLHHDEPLARRAGFPSVFGQGMLHAGVLGIRLALWVGPLNVRSFSLRFTGQVWPGDELVFRGLVIAVADAGDEAIAGLELSVARGPGDEILRAGARAVVAGEAG